jgi:hypothetical protein
MGEPRTRRDMNMEPKRIKIIPALHGKITNHGQRPWYEEGPPEGAVYVR